MSKMQIGRNGLLVLEVELGDDIYICFRPEACQTKVDITESPFMRSAGFNVSTLSLPNSRMAMRVSLPSEPLYVQKETDHTQRLNYVLLDDPNWPESLTLALEPERPQAVLDLKRVQIQGSSNYQVRLEGTCEPMDEDKPTSIDVWFTDGNGVDKRVKDVLISKEDAGRINLAMQYASGGYSRG